MSKHFLSPKECMHTVTSQGQDVSPKLLATEVNNCEAPSLPLH